MKFSIKTIFLAMPIILLHVGCALKYQREDFDAELFIPLVSGLEEPRDPSAVDYDRKVHAFRISKALENQYIANSLLSTGTPKFCSLRASCQQSKNASIRITKVQTEFDWDPLKTNSGIVEDTNGGVLFGRGVQLEAATLLSLRYVFSPLADATRDKWSSPDLSIEIPYRYFQFEDIAFDNTTLDYFDAPMVIYKNATGPTPMCATSAPKRECDPKCFVCDDVAVTIDNRIAPVVTPESTRVKIKAYEKIDMRISDDQGLGSTRYLFPQGTANGWIDVINLSYFPEGRSYMDIVRSLLLAQAGDCNGAYTMYKDRIENAEGLDEYSQVRVLAMIGYLHGQQGGEISAVISDLESKIEDSATLRDKEKLQALVANYTELNLLNCPGN